MAGAEGAALVRLVAERAAARGTLGREEHALAGWHARPTPEAVAPIAKEATASPAALET